jgi:hypothetical protein
VIISVSLGKVGKSGEIWHMLGKINKFDINMAKGEKAGISGQELISLA